MADQENSYVDSDGEVGPFFSATTDENYFEDDIDNPVSMGGEGHDEVEDKSGKFVTLSNSGIDEMNRDQGFFR